MVIAVMLTGYVLNMQLNASNCVIEMAMATNNVNDGLQSDSDSFEDEHLNQTFQFIGFTNVESSVLNLKNPLLLELQAFSVWQPPKVC
ncbi:MAG: hypothetical protein IPF54_08935 [Draconibacterium sp.]|nr:hypothetical protein [Draconibacterium sp.]